MNDNWERLLEDILQFRNDVVNVTQNQVYMILSLQNTVERISNWVWKVQDKKKHWWNLNINKISEKYFK